MKKPPYSCPRCGYFTHIKTDMSRHLFKKSKLCPSLVEDILITDEIAKYILDNRVIKPCHISVVHQPQPIIKLEPQLEHTTKNRVPEAFYQEILQAYLGGQHKPIKNVGVTDVTTDDIHAEIKSWIMWKSAIGQLKAYNSADPKKELHLYLFGECTPDVRENAIEIIENNNIKCYEFVHKKYKVHITECKTNHVVFETFAIVR